MINFSFIKSVAYSKHLIISICKQIHVEGKIRIKTEFDRTEFTKMHVGRLTLEIGKRNNSTKYEEEFFAKISQRNANGELLSMIKPKIRKLSLAKDIQIR